MSFAIVTKYISPTETKGARISARFMVGGGKVFIPFPHELNSEERHRAAANALIQKYNRELTITKSADSINGYVFITEQTK